MKPGGKVEVAKAAGTVFQIRFEMEDGVAVLGVAGAGNFTELLGDGVPFAEDQAGEGFGMEFLVEREVPGEEAMVESGEGELEVVGIEAGTFLDGAGGGAGAEADVPHGLDDGADRGAEEFFSVVVGEGEENIDVGEGEEVFAAVSAEGEHGGFGVGVGLEDAAPEFDEGAIDDRGAAANGSGAVAGAVVGEAHLGHLLGVLGTEVVNGEDGGFHRKRKVRIHVGPGAHAWEKEKEGPGSFEDKRC